MMIMMAAAATRQRYGGTVVDDGVAAVVVVVLAAQFPPKPCAPHIGLVASMSAFGVITLVQPSFQDEGMQV